MSSFENYYYKSIAKKVRELRIKNNLTQEELSDILNKNLKYVGHIERCERKISNKILIKIMEIFKVLPQDFFHFERKYKW